MLRNIILVLLVISMPILFYFRMQYGMEVKDYSDEITQIKLGYRQLDSNGNNRWGHNINYYENELERTNSIANNFNLTFYLVIFLIFITWYLGKEKVK